ncbi:MAG: hypothetical protein KF745_13205 [Phycisphaeraceae bacterium]|nr:hypothetical protein [Phycisphaeraceae bacterium]
MDENVRIMCPNLTCRRVLIVPHSSRGKTVRCRNCTTTIRVPAGKGAGPAPTAPTDQAAQPAASPPAKA